MLGLRKQEANRALALIIASLAEETNIDGRV